MEIISIIGAGNMGHGIAEVSAIASFQVHLYDIKEEILKNAVNEIEKSLTILGRKKKVKIDEIPQIMSRIHTYNDIERCIKDADLIFEVVPEIIDLKKKVIKNIDDYAKKSALLATNTSYMSISELAAVTRRPEQFIGIHFFNPVILMKAVEVIRGTLTSDQTVEQSLIFIKKINKIPVVMADSPGFVVNRVQAAPQILLGKAVERGIFTPNQIDAMMKKLGLPMGAFEIMDYSGLDVTVHGLDYLGSVLGPEYSAPKWMKELVAQGKLGKKTGQGIYDWSSGSAKIDLNDVTDKINAADLMIVQVNEATKLIESGVVKDPNDVDILIKNGTGNPMGIFGIIKSLGKEKIIERLEYFSQLFNVKVFQPTQYLRKI